MESEESANQATGKTAAALEWFHDHVRTILDLSKTAPSTHQETLGNAALTLLYTDAHKEGVENFIRWVVHPRSGIIASEKEMDALPGNVRCVFQRIADQVNTGRVQETQPAISRRKAMGHISRFVSGAFLGSAAGALSSKGEDETAPLKGAAAGVGAAGLLNMALSPSRRAPRESKEEAFLRAPYDRHDPRQVEITVYDVANAAAYSLKKLLEQQQPRLGR